MPFNLFSLSVPAAMNQHVVGAALLNSPVSDQILDYCDLATEIMSDRGFNGADVKSVRDSLGYLMDSFEDDSNVEKLYRKKEKLARAFFGIQDTKRWEQVGKRWCEDRRLQILKPRTPFRKEDWVAISDQDKFVEILATFGIDIGEVDSRIIAQGQYILALWKELVGDLTEEAVTPYWEDLWKIARCYSQKKRLEIEKVAGELREAGALFTSTMVHCLEGRDPRAVVQEIRKAFSRFKGRRPQLKEMAGLSEFEKLALYAFIKSKMERHHGERYPSFAQFLRSLKMAEVFSHLRDFRDFMDPQSLFTRWFKNIVTQPLDIHLNFYDILERLHQKQAVIPFPNSLIDVVWQGLLKADYRSIAIFVEEIGSAQSIEDVERAVLELAEGTIPLELKVQLEKTSNPFERLDRHVRHLEFYQLNPKISAEVKLSEEQILAIFHLILLDEEEHEAFSGRRFRQFRHYLGIELFLAWRTNSVIHLGKFAERLRKEAKANVSPYAIVQKVLQRVREPQVLQEIVEKIFDASPDVRQAFLSNFLEGPPEPAMELLHAGLAISGQDFKRYRAEFNRREELEKAASLDSRRIVESGKGTYDAKDLFVRIAMYHSLRGQISFAELSSILSRAAVPARESYVFADEFSLEVREVQPFFEQVNVGWLESIANYLALRGTPEGLVIELYDVLATYVTYVLHSKKEEREWGFQMLERLQSAESSPAAVSKLLEEILKHFADKVRAEGMRSYQDYFGRLLIAMACQKPWRNVNWGEKFGLLKFRAEKATAEETYSMLDELNEFFGPGLDLVLFRLSEGSPERLEEPQAIRIKLGKEMVNVLPKLTLMKIKRAEEDLFGESVTLQLIPHIGALALFYGYFSENCLALPDYAVHSMEDRTFVPYLMVVNGECKGCVQTFTRYAKVNGKRQKLLIVTGVDPRKSFIVDAGDLLKGLEEGFARIAKQGGYDLVVVPAAEFAQSSRRALLRRDFNKRYSEKVILDEPIGFPQVGVNADGSPKYYNNVAHSEFLVFKENVELKELKKKYLGHF